MRLSLTRRSTAALVAAVLLVVTVSALARASTTDQLEATQDRIESTLQDLRAIEDRADRSAEAVAQAEERVAQLEADLNELLAQMTAQQERVAAAQAEADAAAEERDRISDLVNERARRAWMGSAPSPLMVLGGQGVDAVEDALEQLAMLDALAGRDGASIEALDVARIQSEAAAARLSSEVERLREVQATREAVLTEAEAVLDQRASALAELESQQDRLMAQVETLEDEAEDLQQLIRAEEERQRRAEEERRRQQEEATSAGDDGAEAPTPAPPAQPASGCYQWPASGAVTSEYGPRWGRMHAGIDIDGDTGDPIVAAQNGRVTFARYYSGYGNLTLISHSDGVTTAYAHQSSFGVREGDIVERGQFIGRIGATGNVTGSHLHFETRTSSGAKNPRNYLC